MKIEIFWNTDQRNDFITIDCMHLGCKNLVFYLNENNENEFVCIDGAKNEKKYSCNLKTYFLSFEGHVFSNLWNHFIVVLKSKGLKKLLVC